MTATLLVSSHTLEDACLPQEESAVVPVHYQFVGVLAVVATLFILPLLLLA